MSSIDDDRREYEEFAATPEGQREWASWVCGCVRRELLPVGVEYDCRGRRAVKVFQDAFAARRFYAAKLKAGRRPRVVRVEGGAP
jgi:hypothetical protein